MVRRGGDQSAVDHGVVPGGCRQGRSLLKLDGAGHHRAVIGDHGRGPSTLDSAVGRSGDHGKRQGDLRDQAATLARAQPNVRADPAGQAGHRPQADAPARLYLGAASCEQGVGRGQLRL